MMIKVPFHHTEMIWYTTYVTRNADWWQALWATVIHTTDECSVLKGGGGKWGVGRVSDGHTHFASQQHHYIYIYIWHQFISQDKSTPCLVKILSFGGETTPGRCYIEVVCCLDYIPPHPLRQTKIGCHFVSGLAAGVAKMLSVLTANQVQAPLWVFFSDFTSIAFAMFEICQQGLFKKNFLFFFFGLHILSEAAFYQVPFVHFHPFSGLEMDSVVRDYLRRIPQKTVAVRPPL